MVHMVIRIVVRAAFRSVLRSEDLMVDLMLDRWEIPAGAPLKLRDFAKRASQWQRPSRVRWGCPWALGGRGWTGPCQLALRTMSMGRSPSIFQEYTQRQLRWQFSCDPAESQELGTAVAGLGAW
jgi:hypothetical protein